MKRGTPQHPKTAMLAAELSVPLYAAVGILESLWHWAAQYAKRGDVGRYPNLVIGQAIGWDRAPDELIAALVKCRWLDEHAEHRLVVHDWHEHADDAVHMSLARGTQTFVNGAMPSLARLGKEEKAKAAAAFELAGRNAQQTHAMHTPCTRETHRLSLGLSQGLNTPPTPRRGEVSAGESETSQPHPPGKNGHPSANGNSTHANVKTAKNVGAAAAGPPGFDRFWAAWPPHERKKGKGRCLALWKRKALEENTEAIVAALVLRQASNVG